MDENCINTLWTYGCSWTYSTCHSEDLGIVFWPEVVSKKLGLKLVNRGFGGEGISEAINKLISDLQYIKKNDVVIFQFSYGERLTLPYLNLNLKELENKYWSVVTLNAGEVRFLDQEKLIKYMDFVMAYKGELLFKDFETVNLILDYIEKVIGANVKYWFISIFPYIFDTEVLDFLDNKFFNPNRCILFPSEKIEHRPLKHNFDAMSFIFYEKLRIYDKDYDKKVQWDLKKDDHPNSDGHEKISEFIIESIKKQKKLI